MDRINEEELYAVLEQWNRYLRRKVHLFACGGTAMTLLGVKISTKDVDFVVPDLKEYDYLVRTIKQLGYKQVTGTGWQRDNEIIRFDIFRGKNVYTTALLRSPLDDGNHTLMREYSHLYIGVLNDYDLICSKLMRGTQVDYDDCMALAKAHKGKINMKKLKERYNEMILYDISEERLRGNMADFMERLGREGLL